MFGIGTVVEVVEVAVVDQAQYVNTGSTWAERAKYDEIVRNPAAADGLHGDAGL